MKLLALAAGMTLAASSAIAQPVKCVDAKGKARYIDQSMMAQEKCQPVKDTTNLIQMQPGAMNLKQPARKADDSAQRAANVAQAEKSLADAKKKLADQEAIREGGERNYERVQERLKPFQAAVQAAEKNLEQARKNSR